MTQSGHSALLTNVVADDATGEAGQDRGQDCPPWALCHLPACRGRDPAAALRGDPATDRRPAAEARADMTPRVIASVGLNRRAPASRHLPSRRLLAPDCASTGFGTHRVAHPKPPNRDEWPRFRPMLDFATAFGGWEESSGKFRIRGRQRPLGVAPSCDEIRMTVSHGTVLANLTSAGADFWIAADTECGPVHASKGKTAVAGWRGAIQL